MLVLTRKVGERILVGDDVVITVLDSRGDGVRIGIDAPRGVKIQREEVVRAVIEANAEAAAAASGAGAPGTSAGPAGPAGGGSGAGAAGGTADDAEARLRRALGADRPRGEG
ncbi:MULTISPECIES: carbon storage regulator CsrA [unclassified Curtobacterium]|uniref:carbon storage regulator CsrA n=1 Tax=unclassified Curtobacterium TaxID=257496 RepID=UPI000AEFBDF6|nr:MULTISPECIES: carbon storage regulator CsrA [unclassified Curtobacterium]WIB01628.1 carbon storage regulator CsrA [Curtobacterium sp. MCBA15_012]